MSIFLLEGPSIHFVFCKYGCLSFHKKPAAQACSRGHCVTKNPYTKREIVKRHKAFRRRPSQSRSSPSIDVSASPHIPQMKKTDRQTKTSIAWQFSASDGLIFLLIGFGAKPKGLGGKGGYYSLAGYFCALLSLPGVL